MPVLLPESSAQAALQAQDEARQPKAQNADLKRPVRIVVTQPRRIAAITVAKRVAEELGEKVRGFLWLWQVVGVLLGNTIFGSERWL